MDSLQQFTDRELEQIVEEAALYMCACPGQVAAEIRTLRHLIRYQRDCQSGPGTMGEVHATIAEAGLAAHALMEDCLNRVLEMEGWDRQTLKMPPNLRALRDRLIDEA